LNNNLIVAGYRAAARKTTAKELARHLEINVFNTQQQCKLSSTCSRGYNQGITTKQTTTHTRTHTFNGPFSGTTQVGRYQKGKTNLDFSEARDSEWHWHQLGHMQVCTLLQADNHTNTPPLSFFLQAGCPSCRPTNSVKALKEYKTNNETKAIQLQY